MSNLSGELLLLTAGYEQTEIDTLRVEGDWLHVTNEETEMILPSSQIRLVSQLSTWVDHDERWVVTLSNKEEIAASTVKPIGNYLEIYCCFEGYTRAYLFPGHRVSSVALDRS